MKYTAREIKEYITPYDFYRSELSSMPLSSGRGSIDGGLCPFHDDKSPGSFKLNMISGNFICYSCGTHGGDIIDFVRIRYDLSFPGAMEKLIEDWGLQS